MPPCKSARLPGNPRPAIEYETGDFALDFRQRREHGRDLKKVGNIAVSRNCRWCELLLKPQSLTDKTVLGQTPQCGRKAAPSA